MEIYRNGGKRFLDLALGVPALAVSLPVQAVIAGLVAKEFGRPIFFRQTRPGRHGEPFEMIKFRTMTAERNTAGELLPDEVRLTTFGRFLRSTSLDELPELFNVVKGDMSLVGPRPLLMRYLPRYSPRQARRHEVKPGITGLTQVSGRNNQTWDNKFELDVQYVDRMSFLLDMKILLRTAVGVLRRSGISADGHATAPEFRPDRVSDVA